MTNNSNTSLAKEQDPDLTRITPRLPDELVRRARAQAALDAEPLENLIARAVEAYLENRRAA